MYTCKVINLYKTHDKVIILSKDLNISVLMDFYGQLLTEKQYNTLDLYYNQDFSLAEIAEHSDISRQGVRDSIKRGEKQLIELEEKLGLAERFLNLDHRLSTMKELIDKIEDENKSQEISDDLTLLKKLSDELEQII